MMILYFISLVLLYPAVGGQTLCQVCLCGRAMYFNKSMFITNCTYSNITENNIWILQQLPEETEVFIFTGNSVPILPLNIFGNRTNLTSLKVIDMTDNKIEEIKGKTFHHVPLVERLILDHNSISLNSHPSHPRVFSNFESLRELHLTDAFQDYLSDDLARELHSIFVGSNLKNLEKLHLEQNEISGIADTNVFCDLENLMDLHLGYNKLKNLSFNITCLPRLRFIDLEENAIERFTPSELSVFDSFPATNRSLSIDLCKNPFICDCVTNKLYSWLKKTRVNVRKNDTIQCHYMKNSYYTIFLKYYNATECEVTVSPYHGISVTDMHILMHYFYISVSSVLVLILIYLSLKYSFVHCRHSVVPPGKVHYVVIRNSDDRGEVHV